MNLAHPCRLSSSGLLSGLLLTGCAGPTTAPIDATPFAAPPIEADVRVVDGRSGEEVAFQRLVDQIAGADAVFLGETHTDETTHRVEVEVYRRLIDATDGKVILAMEMFERDVQPTLDAYLQGEIDEREFLAKARPWSNYATAYRPLIETAKAHHLPVVASNFPAPVRRKLGMSGDPGKLSDDDRQWLPEPMLPPTDEYWDRVMNAVRSHRQMMGGDDPASRLYSGQNLWDNTMADSIARALDRQPGHLVLHVNGGFHSQLFDGTVRQLRLRRPDLDIRTIAIDPTDNPRTAKIGDTVIADYVAFATARASDYNEGTYTVRIAGSLDYRLHLPESADEQHRAPLLIWLPDDGSDGADALALWRQRLGEQVAIAVIDPLHREQQDDLSLGRRWFWPDQFGGDLSTGAGAVAEAWGYLLRNLPLDASRVVVAGEGSGATVAAAVAVFHPDLTATVHAFGPRRFEGLRDFSLPGQRSAGERHNRLRVHVTEDSREWWQQEAGEYNAVGIDAQVVLLADDAWSVADRQLDALAGAAGVSLTRPATTRRAHIVTPTDSPLARTWAARLADRHREGGIATAVFSTPPATGLGDSQPVDVAVHAADFASGARLPLASGPFGGTTVIVLQPGTTTAEQAAWLALETDDVLTRRSRFHRLRIAAADGERDLPAVLAKLLAEGRRNVLVVPATFCADGDTMRQLAASVRPLADQMSLQFLPGLGGQLAIADAKPHP